MLNVMEKIELKPNIVLIFYVTLIACIQEKLYLVKQEMMKTAKMKTVKIKAFVTPAETK